MPSNIHNIGEDDGATTVIAQQASEWFALLDAGLTVRQQEEFTRWLQADERHAQIFGELEETWSRLGKLREIGPVATVPPERSPGRQKVIWLSGALAASAAAVLAALAWWPAAEPTPAPFATVASTDIGMMRRLELPDGSVVRLNTDSAVTVRFTATERQVKLVRGEAHFQVAKNPARPFVVSIGQVAVRAVGTAFDIRMRPEAVEVLVTEGKVRVDDAARGKTLLATVSANETPLLKAGERALIAMETVPGPAAVKAVPPEEIGQTLAWEEGRLEFVATPLAEIVAEFNRYNRHKLVIADARLAARPFGGTFAMGDSDELVRLLEADFGSRAERGETETTLRLAP